MKKDNPKLTIISLGWGVQSWALAAMSALGDLPPVDFAVHSDTAWEMKATYEFAQDWTSWLEDHGVKVVTVNGKKAQWVSGGSRMLPTYTINPPVSKLNNGKNKIMIPANTATVNGGQLRRQCTQRWKIAPVRRCVSQWLKDRDLKKSPGIVEQWLGITTDEWHRAKDSQVKYITHRYPLLDLGMSRDDCLTWLARHNLPSPGKSSCTFCPYHSKQAWRNMKKEDGPDWKQAVEIDKLIRDKRPPYDLFVHSSRLPLQEAVDIPEDHGWTQASLLNEECDSGYCFM